MNYTDLQSYDLLAKLYLIETDFGGRQASISDGYRGQFFWHINHVSSTDWDASYVFENGMVNPGEEVDCKIILSEGLKKSSCGNFPIGKQFGVREGSTIIGVGVILKSNLKRVKANAYNK